MAYYEGNGVVQRAIQFLSNKYKNRDILIDPIGKKIYFKQNGKVTSKDCNLTLEDIRKQIADIGYHAPYHSSQQKQLFMNDRLENTNIPYFNFLYYYLFCLNLKIPTMEEMVEKYIELYCEEISSNTYKIKDAYFYHELEPFTFNKNELLGRVFRAYNSFHREVEMLYQLAQYDGIKIKYQFQADLDGVDIIILHNNKRYGLATFVETDRGDAFKLNKEENIHKYEGYKMMNIRLKFGVNDVDYKGVKLYSPEFVRQIYQKIIFDV